VFTANGNFSVDALGIYYNSKLTGSEIVGLYDSSGNLLASATVPTTGTQVNGYVFQSITPVALTSGDQYTVDVFVDVNNPWFYSNDVPIQNSALVTYNLSNYNYIDGLAFPTAHYSLREVSYYGPNFEIPEPSLVLLLSLGIGAVTLVGWRFKA
jgi:hypothetical protein